MFRLFKEAQLVSKLDAAELKVLETARVALGKESIADLVESFNPSAEDYSEWLRIASEIAAENGRHLTRSEFNDLFTGEGNFEGMGVFDNDPNGAPPYEMQEMIVKKLWSDYKAAQHGARVAKVAQAQEEEEAIKSAQDFAHSEYASDEQPGCADGSCDDMPQGGDTVGDAFEPEGGEEDLSMDDIPSGASIEFDLPDEDEGGEVTLSDDDIEAIAARIVSQLKSDEDSFGGSDEVEVEPEVAPPVIAKEEENEESTKPKKTNLQQMLSGPRSTITQAQKEIESEGESAWKAHQIPQNPHPKKSIAYAAWERGMKRAVKTHFGFEDKPVVQPKKKK